MKRTAYRLITCSTLLLGVGLWVGSSMRFESTDKLSYEPNVATMKGSPYGKVLALAMQGPIDKYWHSGQSHEHAETLNANHEHQDGTSHSHADHEPDHSDGHAHDHPHEPVTTKVASIEVSSEDDGEDLRINAQQKKPLHIRARKKLKLMEATAHRKTDGSPLSPAHRKYLQSVTEDKLVLAYELDPTNYTNYGNLHLFVATTTFGKSAANDDAAVALAKKTLRACRLEASDPAPMVTAMSAAYNIIYHIGRYYESFTVAEAKASLKEFDDCLARYEELLEDAVANGRIVSVARFEELNERVRYMKKLRYAQGVYMKRMMATEMAQILQPEDIK